MTGPANGRRVLVVEDETLIAFLLQDVLEEDGFKVLGPAATLSEAMALAAADPAPDAAVMDLNLRGEMSWPAVDILLGRGVPVVIVSGYGALDAVRDRPIAAVLAKPVNPEVVSRTVAACVKGSAEPG